MDKRQLIGEPGNFSASSGRILTVLAGAVLVLGATVFVLLIGGTWYLSNLQQPCIENGGLEVQPKFKVEFEVNVRNNMTVNREHVAVDEERQVEFSLISAPQTGHITHLVLFNFAKRLEVSYNSETQSCYFKHMNEAAPKFQEDVELLRRSSKQTVESVRTVTYTVGDHVRDINHIPHEMTSICTLHNSYWIHPGVSSGGGERQKRACKRYCSMQCNHHGDCSVVCGMRCDW